MSNSNIPKDPKVYAAILVLFVVILLFMPKSGKFKYNYKKGSPWAYETLVAQFDFPILKTDDQIRLEKEAVGKSIVPYYKYSDKNSQESIRIAESMDFGSYSSLRHSVVTSLLDIFSMGSY